MGNVVLRQPLFSGGGDPVTGSPWISARIKKVDDGTWYDFDDDTFKAAPWIEQDKTLVEPDAVSAPGKYEWTQAVGTWDDGEFVIDYDYAGPEIPKFKDGESVIIANGEWSTPSLGILDDKVVIVDTKVDTVDTKVDTVDTKVVVVDAKVVDTSNKVTTVDGKVEDTRNRVTVVDNKVVGVEVKVDAVQDDVTPTLANTAEVTAIINDSKIDSQVKAADADTTTPNSLSDAAAEKIADAFLAKVIDGTQTTKQILTLMLAVIPGKEVSKDGGVYTYKNQAGDIVATLTFAGADITTEL